MKNITKFLLFTISIAFAFSSCNVQKRLHNPGYHVQLSKNHHVDKTTDKSFKSDEEFAVKEVKTEEFSQPNIEQQQENEVALVSTNQLETNYSSDNYDVASNDESISLQNTTTSRRNGIQESYHAENQTSKVKTQEVKHKTKFKKATKSKKAANGESSGGVALLILIILCLFPLINLIPVYITDGGITLNFWITLILNLTYIGAVIFSLLVVLGIVSLA